MAPPPKPALVPTWEPYHITLGPRLKRGRAPRELPTPAPTPLLPVPVRETPGQRRVRGQQEAFLAAYRRLGTQTAAAQVLGIDARMHFHWKAQSAAYREAFQQVRVQAVELLETEARRRALFGVDELILVGGRPVVVEEPGAAPRLLTKKVFSDSLLIFLLKANKPGKYRERFLDPTPPGGPEGIAGDEFSGAPIEFDWERVSPAELETVRAILQKAKGYAGIIDATSSGNGGPQA